MDDVIARVRARAVAAADDREARKARMRAEYPIHAALVDLFRTAGIDVTKRGGRVTVDGVTFGKRTPDPEPPGEIYSAGVFGKAVAQGLIQPTKRGRF